MPERTTRGKGEAEVNPNNEQDRSGPPSGLGHNSSDRGRTAVDYDKMEMDLWSTVDGRGYTVSLVNYGRVVTVDYVKQQAT